jgi:hypothetical protein
MRPSPSWLPTLRFRSLAAFALPALVPFALSCTASKDVGSAGTVDGSAGGGAETTCNPLAAKPITLGTVVGAGKDVAGTVYVDSANGVFVSGSGALNRQRVTGTGQSGNDEFLFTFEPPGDDGAGTRNLLVETSGSAASAMALGPADSKSFLGESDAGVTPLALVDPATLAGLPVVNTPKLIQYVADVANGGVLLTTVPMNSDSASSNGGLSVFYGPASSVAERAITAFEQTLSNDGTMTFLVDGTPYVLAFGTVNTPDSGPLGVFTLQTLTPEGGSALTVTLRSPAPTTVPSGLSFTCLP